jgi:hypothetical protein
MATVFGENSADADGGRDPGDGHEAKLELGAFETTGLGIFVPNS